MIAARPAPTAKDKLNLDGSDVKQNSKKTENFLKLRDIFLDYPGNEKFKGEKGFQYGLGYFWEWKAYVKKTVKNCPFHVPESLQKFDRRQLNRAAEKKPPQARYKTLADDMHVGKVLNGNIKNVAEAHLQRAPMIAVEVEPGRWGIYPGSVRGDDYYETKQVNRIDIASTILDRVPGTKFFATLTYDIRKNHVDIFEAWDWFNEMVTTWLRKVKRLGMSHYILVMESTARGYPHAHVCFATENKFFDTWEDAKGRLRCADDVFYNAVRAAQPAPIFDLQVAKNHQVKSYCIKYITKGMGRLFSPDFDKKIPLKKEQRKALLSYLMPIMTQKRQFRISRNLSVPRDDNDEAETQEVARQIRDLPEIPIWTEKASGPLIALLNNLTSQCRSHARVIFDYINRLYFSDYEGHYLADDSEEIKLFKQVSYPLGCPGCVITDFVEKELLKMASRKK